MTLLATHAAVLVGAAVACWLAVGVGRLALREADLPDRLGQTVVEAVLGVLPLSLAAGALLWWGAFRMGALGLTMGAWALTGAAGHWWRRRAPRPNLPRRVPTGLEWLAGAALAGAVGSALVGALAPTTGWDANAYHFALPALWVRHGGLTPRPDVLYGYHPLNLHACYAVAYAFGGTTGATLVGVAAHGGLGWLLWRWAAAVAGPRAGAAAALAYAGCATPGVWADTGGTEPGLCIAGTAALWLLVEARERASARLLVLAAVCTGFTAGMKVTAWGLAIPWCALLASPGALARRWVLSGAGVAVILACPWYVRAALATGNPVHPMLGRLFGATLARLPSTPMLVSSPARYLGGLCHSLVVGYAGFVLAAGTLVVTRPRMGLGVPGLGIFVGITVIGLAAICPWDGEHVWRYAALALPPIIVWAVATASASPGRKCRCETGWIVLLALAAGGAQAALAFRAVGKLPAAIGLIDRHAFLADRQNTYPLLRHLNALPPGMHVRALLTDGRNLYCEQPFVYAAEHHGYVDWAALSDPAAFRRRLVELGITHVVLNLHPTGRTTILQRWLRERPDYFDAAHFRLVLRHTGASREGNHPAELWEFRP